MKFQILLILLPLLLYSCDDSLELKNEKEMYSVTISNLTNFITIDSTNGNSILPGGRTKLESDKLHYTLYGNSKDEIISGKTYYEGLQDTIYLPALSNRDYRLAIHYELDDRNSFNPEYYNYLDFNPAIDGTEFNVELKPLKGRVKLKAKEPIQWPNIENLDVFVEDNQWAFTEIFSLYDLQYTQWAERTGLALYAMNENSYLETNWLYDYQVHTIQGIYFYINVRMTWDNWDKDYNAFFPLNLPMDPGKSYTIIIDYQKLFDGFFDVTGNISLQDFAYIEEEIILN